MNYYPYAIKTSSSDFEQGKQLVATAEYEKAESYLLKTVMRQDQDYTQAVRLLGVVYDHTARPEKAILNLRDFLQRNTDSLFDIVQAKALLLKNLAKIKTPIEKAEEKQFIARIMTSKEVDTGKVLETLLTTLDFNCGAYCVEEVNYLREIQVQLLYAVEINPDLHKTVSETLNTRYDYFEEHLKQLTLDLEYRKKIGFALYDALQKLKSSHLETNTLGSVKTAAIINHLEASQKRIERWLYE